MEIRFRLAGPTKPVILVPTFVNGKGPYDFALDTGAGLTVLSADLARNMEVETGRETVGVGAGGKMGVAISSIDSLAIGTVKRAGLQVAVADLSSLSRAAGVRLDGIIGYNFLGNFRVIIDYPKGLLRLE